MARSIWKKLRVLLAGPRLMAAIERNDQAADNLDALVREVLNR